MSSGISLMKVKNKVVYGIEFWGIAELIPKDPDEWPFRMTFIPRFRRKD